MRIRNVNTQLTNIPQNYEDNIETIITELKTRWKEKLITIETFHLLLKETMELVDKFNCPGIEKKQHVKSIVRIVVIELIENPDHEKVIIDIIDKDILGNTIDLIILASQGKLNLKNKKTQNQLLSCFKTIIYNVINIVKSKKNKPTPTPVPVEPEEPTPTPVPVEPTQEEKV